MLGFHHYLTLTGGPFADEAVFDEWLSDSFFKGTPGSVKEGISRRLSIGHRTVFAHRGLRTHNILVKYGRTTGVIDWGYGRWYPEWREYAKFFARIHFNKGWADSADDIFSDSYLDELVTYQAISRWQYL